MICSRMGEYVYLVVNILLNIQANNVVVVIYPCLWKTVQIFLTIDFHVLGTNTQSILNYCIVVSTPCLALYCKLLIISPVLISINFFKGSITS